MSARIIVNGAQGNMGTLACETIRNHPDFELVGELTHRDNLQDVIRVTKADIVIDFTRADCVYENCLTVIECGAHPVIGTTGLLDAQIQGLKERCDEHRLGGIIVPNFSIAAVLMMRFAEESARFFSEVEIVEAHHQRKLDSPSGTAMKTAEMIAKARRAKKNDLALREIIPGARGCTYHDINIHSMRLPGLIARQQVIFGSQGETLTLTHESIDRVAYMPGLILACQRVQQLDSLYYGLECLL